MEDINGFINFENEKLNFSCKEFRIKFIIDDEMLRNKFYQTYNRKKNFVLSGIAIEFVQKRCVQFYINEMRVSGDFEVLCIIIGQMPELNETYDNIRFESSYIDSIFRFRYYFIDEVVRKDNQENLYKNKKTIEENAFTINGKNYPMQYFVGNWITRGIGSSFRINGKLCISLVDKTIQEVYCVCKLLSKFIRFTTHFPTISKPDANGITLCTNDNPVAYVYTNDIIRTEDYSSSAFGLSYATVKGKINKLVELLYNGVDGNDKDTLFIDHLNYDVAKNTPVERFMSQCRGFEYLFKRCESSTALVPFYDKAKTVFSIKKKSELAAKLLYVHGKYARLASILLWTIDEKDLVDIFSLRNSITHGDYCYAELQQEYARLPHILDNFLLVLNLKLIGFDETEIETILKNKWGVTI